MAPPTKESATAAFAKVDKEGKGKLNEAQLREFLKEVAEDDVEKVQADDDSFIKFVLNMVDGDGDKMASLAEILKGMELVEGEPEVGGELGKEVMIGMIKAADKNGDGFLTAGELKDVMSTVSPGDKDVDKTVEMIIKMGTNSKDKKIKIEEVIKLITAAEEDDPKEQMRAMFRMCDSDGSGSVSTKELAEFMKSMAGDDSDDSDDEDDNKMMIKMMMAMADKDGDGKLNFDEFCQMMDRD